MLWGRLLRLTFCGILLLSLPAFTSARGRYYLTANGAFTVGFIYNQGVGITGPGTEGPTLGTGFRSEIGVGRTFHDEKFCVEVGVGTYDMSNPTDLNLIGLDVEKDAATFHHKYFSGSVRLGYVIATAKKYNLELIGGASFLINREENFYDGRWEYPNNSVWHFPDDLDYGRYSIKENYNTNQATVFHGGLRLSYSFSNRLQLRSTLYYEQAFKVIRSVLYSTERDYVNNEDLKYQILSTYTGDAVGLQIGVRYFLK